MVKEEKVENEFMQLQPFKSDLSPPLESGWVSKCHQDQVCSVGSLQGSVLAPLCALQEQGEVHGSVLDDLILWCYSS